MIITLLAIGGLAVLGYLAWQSPGTRADAIALLLVSAVAAFVGIFALQVAHPRLGNRIALMSAVPGLAGLILVLAQHTSAIGPLPTGQGPAGSLEPISSGHPGASAEIGAGSVTLVGAGDIADCDSPFDEQTALLLDGISGAVFTAGDNAYESGTLEEFMACYEPTWGRHKHRTRPAPGGHEYRTPGAEGYFAYFGESAGDPERGYYAYDLGAWRIYVLNSECGAIGGCEPGSPQEQWLRQELATNDRRCVAAYGYMPLYSSGVDGGSPGMRPLWNALYEAGAELYVSGHDHDYERFAKQDGDGYADGESGMRQFVVGTGGKSVRQLRSPLPNSEVSNGETFGVLKLTLHPDRYEWEFVPIEGQTFTDSGSEPCH